MSDYLKKLFELCVRIHTLGFCSARVSPPSSVRARMGARSRLGEEQGDQQGEGPPGTAQATGTGALPDQSSGVLRRTRRDEVQTCIRSNHGKALRSSVHRYLEKGHC